MADLASSELVSALDLDAKMVDPKAVKLGKPSRKAIGKAKSPRAPKGTKVVPAHPPYLQMVMEAISSLKERSGSSQYAIAKHLEAKYKGVLPVNYKKTLSIQLKKLCVKGKLLKVKSSYKLSEELKKPAKAGKAPGAYKGPKSPGRPKGSKNKAKSVKVPKTPKAPKSPKAPKAMKVAKPVKLAKKPKAAKPGRPPKSPAEKKAPAVKKVVAAKPGTKKPTTPKKAAPKKPKSLKAKSPKKGKSPAAKRAKK